MSPSRPTSAGSVHLDWTSSRRRLIFDGDWTLAHYNALERQLDTLPAPVDAGVEVDLTGLGRLDTAGAALLVRCIGCTRLVALAEATAELPPERLALIQTIGTSLRDYCQPLPRTAPATGLLVLERIGLSMERTWRQTLKLLGFIGVILEALARNAFHPKRWRITALVAQMEQTGWDAVPIVALLTFMVGAVVAFLGATVLADFGATYYTVDLVAFSFLREFGVLLTAILIAGRTASAFTAQLGSMKANQELDAIRTLGLSPIDLLVLPRVLALLLTLPMLTFIAMIAGLAGGAAVCALTLEIPPIRFLALLKADIGVRHFVIGMVKAPVFAFLIATIGCLEGLKVSGSAQSVGEHTTSSVVQSIFVVILVDAVAALFFMEIGW
jgi:phospholipid/cholesterol/gamma-HCH transport system permease protein